MVLPFLRSLTFFPSKMCHKLECVSVLLLTYACTERTGSSFAKAIFVALIQLLDSTEAITNITVQYSMRAKMP